MKMNMRILSAVYLDEFSLKGGYTFYKIFTDSPETLSVSDISEIILDGVNNHGSQNLQNLYNNEVDDDNQTKQYTDQVKTQHTKFESFYGKI